MTRTANPLSLCLATLRTWGKIHWHRRPQRGEPTTLAANALAATIPLWGIRDTPEVRAHIALWHRTWEEYRGYLLYSDPDQRTVLLDLHTWSYVKAASLLIHIDGIDRARQFVNALCARIQPGKET